MVKSQTWVKFALDTPTLVALLTFLLAEAGVVGCPDICPSLTCVGVGFADDNGRGTFFGVVAAANGFEDKY